MRIPRTPPDAMKVLSGRKPSELGDLLQHPGYSDLARRCETDYWHWDKLRVAGNAKIDLELAWAIIKFGRQQRYRSLNLTGHNGVKLRLTVPDKVQRELMLIDQQLAGRLLSDEESPLTADQRERFIIGALREEAIASSMLEGAATTRQEAKRMLKSGRKARNTGEQMVLNNYRAILFVRENRHQELNPSFLLELQTILTEKTLDDADGVGRFRTEQDSITVVDVRDSEVMHSPPPATELETRVERLCAFANEPAEQGEFIHPVVKACILHFQLGFDHPFCDGNGRTARAVFYWSMLRHGYWLFEYLPISRLIYRCPAKYVRAFLYTETDEFDATYFLMFKIQIIARARQDLRKYIREKMAQIAQARRLFSSDRRLNHRQREVILQAAKNPDRHFTIADHQSRHSIAYGTARSDLLNLADWGYLNQTLSGKRYEYIPSDKILTLSE